MLLTDPPYGTTRNFWDVPLPLPELWEAVKWAVKPEGAVLFFAQCPYDKVLGASNLAMLRYEWVWYKSRCTGFLNARRAPLKKTENILVFYQKSPAYFPQFEQGKPYKKIHRCSGNSPNYGKFERTSGESDGQRFPGNVLAFPTVTTTVHPTQKPVALCEYLICTYTRPGEVVADICAGSGTTAVAALNTGRRFVCFETAPAFYGPATERIRRAREALRLIRAWGFTYKSVAFVWLKKNKKADSWFYGLGFWTRANAEVCLLATKGHPKRQAADIHQLIISPIEAHSKKPDETREKIVALMGDRPRVELFARQTPPGWDVWGNEVEPTAGLWHYGAPAKSEILWGEEEQQNERTFAVYGKTSDMELATTRPEDSGKEDVSCPM